MVVVQYRRVNMKHGSKHLLHPMNLLPTSACLLVALLQNNTLQCKLCKLLSLQPAMKGKVVTSVWSILSPQAFGGHKEQINCVSTYLCLFPTSPLSPNLDHNDSNKQFLSFPQTTIIRIMSKWVYTTVNVQATWLPVFYWPFCLLYIRNSRSLGAC